MLDEKMLGRLKDALGAEREQVLVEIAEYEREDQETLSDVSGENNYRDHMADQGSATFARELDMTLEDNAREMLGSIDAALARMDEGVYGVCTRCGKEIRPERLEAVPAAELCITCKEWEESR
ncbi:MAG: conjugal transfer protein TraR [Actinobacteria bacterium HGW-Actinobacteria-1]|jgi:DnaK suppressor protein|nr:MAG: conjugal transfer protein TraR [Actinobacteria bacterium HGW-Actinobacteria-1]